MTALFFTSSIGFFLWEKYWHHCENSSLVKVWELASQTPLDNTVCSFKYSFKKGRDCFYKFKATHAECWVWLHEICPSLSHKRRAAALLITFNTWVSCAPACCRPRHFSRHLCGDLWISDGWQRNWTVWNINGIRWFLFFKKKARITPCPFSSAGSAVIKCHWYWSSDYLMMLPYSHDVVSMQFYMLFS